MNLHTRMVCRICKEKFPKTDLLFYNVSNRKTKDPVCHDCYEREIRQSVVDELELERERFRCEYDLRN